MVANWCRVEFWKPPIIGILLLHSFVWRLTNLRICFLHFLASWLKVQNIAPHCSRNGTDVSQSVMHKPLPAHSEKLRRKNSLKGLYVPMFVHDRSKKVYFTKSVHPAFIKYKQSFLKRETITGLVEGSHHLRAWESAWRSMRTHKGHCIVRGQTRMFKRVRWTGIISSWTHTGLTSFCVGPFRCQMGPKLNLQAGPVLEPFRTGPTNVPVLNRSLFQASI